MSALLQGRSIDGAIPVFTGEDPPAFFHNGIPYHSPRVIATTQAPVDHYHQGLPFSAAGRLCTAVGNVAYFGGGAAPFNADGDIALAAVSDHYSSGVPYSPGGAVTRVDGFVNLYPNAEFAGGGVNTPPNLHTFPFLTNGANVVPDPLRPGFNQVFSNTDNISGRSVLQFNVNGNTALTVGNTYRIQYRVQNLNNQNYNVALGAFSPVDVTLGASFTRSAPGTTSTLFIEFTPTTAAWTLSVRIGCGTTANNTAQLLIDRPALEDITP